ncbi:MAG: lytic transglycosylase domain-containing protein [Acidobacteriota bacterium]|nr:lytic transglycosylase domain-containing protein [Acidobacteriota bacterium]
MKQKRFFDLFFIRTFIVVCICVFFIQINVLPNTQYDKLIQDISMKHGVDSSLIHSIIRAESNYNPSAISQKGAVGLMQLMPETAKQYGVRNVFDPKENVEGGVKYIKDLIRLYNAKTDLVLAAYNAGQEAVKKYSGIPPYDETRNYIERVKSSYDKPLIKHRTKIYKFLDESGRVVFTNDRNLYLLNKKED